MFQIELAGHPTDIFAPGDKFTDGEGVEHTIPEVKPGDPKSFHVAKEKAWDAYKCTHLRKKGPDGAVDKVKFSGTPAVQCVEPPPILELTKEE